MIDDFEAVLVSADHPFDEELERPDRPREDDDPDGWRSEFRSHIDDPE